MSYHHSPNQEWQGNNEYDAHQPSTGGASPFRDARQEVYSPGLASPANSYSNNNNNMQRSPHLQNQEASSSSAHHQPQQGYGQDDEEQYPVGRPLSYFPTHHQPLSQQEYDDEQQRTSQYHQMEPLEHAQSSLSSRTPQWGGGGYSGYQPQSDIPLVGIDIVSSNLEATRNGTQFSDTRTPENMKTPRMGANESVYSSGAGVGGADNYNHQDQQQQYDNKHNEQLADGTGNNQYDQYGQTAPPPQPPLIVDSNGEPIPKALLDPKVQRQLNKRKVWRPWFVWIVSAIQVAVLVFEFVKGYQRTGQIIETSPFNPMIGPGTGTIIAVGARFVPCMRSTYLDNLSIECPDNTTQICTLSEVCSFTPVITTGVAPDQWLRFITPIFLHGGIIHLLFNLLFQLRTGADLERDMGWWRFSIIYMISGLSIMVLVSFAFGLLPYLDNFAHIGGFLAGILSGLVFMPVVYFSKRDKYIKLGLRVIALPLIVLFFVLGLNSFYKGVNNCSWCKYLSCLPINGWCDAFNNTNGTTSSGN
ncbi:hypothetical protein BGZ58_004054 [Dissophora ornata]|nr:hypothetical protein BGZ58_004054 [Dissophora ornata]